MLPSLTSVVINNIEMKREMILLNQYF